MSNYFSKFNPSKGIPFMDNRDKGNNDEITDKQLHIVDFGFITTKYGDCAVAIFKEDAEHFYFLNSIITDVLHHIESDDMRSKLADQAIVFTKKWNKDETAQYMTFEFIGEDGDSIPF